MSKRGIPIYPMQGAYPIYKNVTSKYAGDSMAKLNELNDKGKVMSPCHIMVTFPNTSSSIALFTMQIIFATNSSIPMAENYVEDSSSHGKECYISMDSRYLSYIIEHLMSLCINSDHEILNLSKDEIDKLSSVQNINDVCILLLVLLNKCFAEFCVTIDQYNHVRVRKLLCVYISTKNINNNYEYNSFEYVKSQIPKVKFSDNFNSLIEVKGCKVNVRYTIAHMSFTIRLEVSGNDNNSNEFAEITTPSLNSAFKIIENATKLPLRHKKSNTIEHMHPFFVYKNIHHYNSKLMNDMLTYMFADVSERYHCNFIFSDEYFNISNNN